MPCLIDLTTLINGNAADPYGNWKVISTHSPAITVEKGACGGPGVSLGTNIATSTDNLLNGANGVAYNDPNNNPGPLPQTNPPETDICMDQVPDGTIVQIQYCISYPQCAPVCATISITVQDGCQFFSTPNGTGNSCATPIVITSSSTDVNLAGPNGITNGGPWKNLADCNETFVTPNTYPNLDGGTTTWVPRVNMTTGIIDTPDDIVCGHCETFQFTANPTYTPSACAAGECGSAGNISVRYDICEQAASKGFRHSGSISRPGGAGPYGITSFTVRRNGTLINLGSFPSLYRWNPNLGANGEYEASLTVVNSIQAAIQSQLVGATCYKTCATVFAFTAPPDGPPTDPHSLWIGVYFCNVCNLKPGLLSLDGDPINSDPYTCTSFVPGVPPTAYSGPTGDC